MEKAKPRGSKAQGLAEYVLIIALVGLVSIVILFFVAPAINRVFALVSGMMGTQKNDSSASSSTVDAIDIAQADCYIIDSSHTYQIMVSLNVSTNISINDINVSSPNGFLSGITGAGTAYSLQTDPAPGDASKCPTTVVAQARHATSIRKVTVQHF